ncbi:RNA-directed DNA polymerase [Shewanella sp. SM29]|uniref:RNA-directed DNA polymerase n=1 Tax=Shewanella sp. SM29 TaxID=2912795 RepID=UPI0021DA05F5|nr:RNA-directed DNA polymerase [Shewanella sp. SM29]MCU8075863.1 RNA-directed DNA polymerase [Shewanella sp. SM29]
MIVFIQMLLLSLSLKKNIKTKILNLHSKIINGSDSDSWWEDIKFIGDFRYVPKELDDNNWNNKVNVHYRSVDPITDWKQRFKENSNKRLNVKYRQILCPSVEYQILSALWILKVGHLFEAKLDKELSYGNRLRRRSGLVPDSDSLQDQLNLDASGLFSPYFSAYKNWRGNGLDAMKKLISEGHDVTAITMDLAGFYHNASPNFLLRPSFLRKLGLSLSSDERKFTRLILESINNWYLTTPDYEQRTDGALPVGSSISKIISNVLLYELDKQISEGLEPEYYGRYVDDIFLVFKTPDEELTGDSILSHMSKHVECLKINRVKGEQPDLRLRFVYAQDSDLKFTASKQKIFSLSSKHGLDFINQISSQIRAQSSEYRMLPEVPRDSVVMADKTLLASPDASLIPDALRKADVVSIRRLGLSLLLRDIESYSEDLSSANWIVVRNEFYGLVERYLLTPKGLFDMFGYLHRVFQVMISNYDFIYANKFIDKLQVCLDLIGKTTVRSKLNRVSMENFHVYLFEKLSEAALKASTKKDFIKWESLRKLIVKLSGISKNDIYKKTKSQLKAISNELLLADFGVRSYKDYWYYSQATDSKAILTPRARSVRAVLRLDSIHQFATDANLKKPYWPALAFSTRPLSVQEIALICPKVLDDSVFFKDVLFGLRGAKTNQYNISRKYSALDGCWINVPKPVSSKIYVALTNFETTQVQYDSALNEIPDESLDRYEKINRLINDILKSSPKSDYIVFPECSLPRRWAVNIASKMAKQKISLIAGIEYYKHSKGKNIIRNDCLVSLVTNWPGYNSNFLFMQPKILPSHCEKNRLEIKRLKLFTPNNELDLLPIYRHGDFNFGVLICSDLTNPRNRVRFQGEVDCLFVLEWNQDVKTFSYLVEGAAHDIHSFVIQVNNREYGDSRVRAPFRVDYKRDLVRVKGGLSDTFLISEVDFKSLRKFQKNGVMTDDNSDFKPVPIGFKMSDYRK